MPTTDTWSRVNPLMRIRELGLTPTRPLFYRGESARKKHIWLDEITKLFPGTRSTGIPIPLIHSVD
jgi:hypothetical protein